MTKKRSGVYVICHSMSSVDGRILSDRWGMGDLSKVFEIPAAKIKVDAWIVGRTTFQEFSSHKAHRLGKADPSIRKTDFVGRLHSPSRSKTYAVGIDPSGKCRWDTNQVDGDHVIEVLTEKVSTAYLRHLREKEVSYIFAGKKEIDLALALEKLNHLFGVKRCRVDGGGTVNGSFLKSGLINEFSHVVVPVADGSMQTSSVFDVEIGHTQRSAKKLSLRSVAKLKNDVLWIRYRVKN